MIWHWVRSNSINKLLTKICFFKKLKLLKVPKMTFAWKSAYHLDLTRGHLQTKSFWTFTEHFLFLKTLASEDSGPSVHVHTKVDL